MVNNKVQLDTVISDKRDLEAKIIELKSQYNQLQLTQEASVSGEVEAL